MENLNIKKLKKCWHRLKKDTKSFSSEIVRDPLDFLDFESNLEGNLNQLISEINQFHYKPHKPYLHLSPKGKGINRPTVVFDIRDAIVYRFCLEQIEKELLDISSDNTFFGNRITPNFRAAQPSDFYEKWFEQWEMFQKKLKDLKEKKGLNCLVITDIVSYFEHINLQLLKDMLRSQVRGKKELIDLLFYFLENVSSRDGYASNTFTGLPQENIDCSRVLSHFYLAKHDKRMLSICRATGSEFLRYVDDMNIGVSDETNGRIILKYLTQSLRSQCLMASIEKTNIIKNQEIDNHFYFEENLFLKDLELKTYLALKSEDKEQLKKLQKILVKAYKKFNKKSGGNWVKVLKRYYTSFKYLQSNFILNELPKHLVSTPLLVAENKITGYLLTQQPNSYLKHIINYLYSKENLYPVNETKLIELLLEIDNKKIGHDLMTSLNKLGQDIFFKRNGYAPQSEYARALSILLIYKYDETNLKKLAYHYLKFNEGDYLVRKYLIFASLTLDNQSITEKVLAKAKREQNLSVQRLIDLVENINHYEKNILGYLKTEQKFLYKEILLVKYLPIRKKILLDLAEKFAGMELLGKITQRKKELTPFL